LVDLQQSLWLGDIFHVTNQAIAVDRAL